MSGRFLLPETYNRILPQMGDNMFKGDARQIAAPVVPTGLQCFIRLVVPELRRRSLVRDDYAGTTLRENLGQRRPPRAD